MPREEGIPTGGPSVGKIGKGFPLGVAEQQLPPSKPANTVLSRRKSFD